jgi:hypothetical protein
VILWSIAAKAGLLARNESATYWKNRTLRAPEPYPYGEEVRRVSAWGTFRAISSPYSLLRPYAFRGEGGSSSR